MKLPVRDLFQEHTDAYSGYFSNMRSGTNYLFRKRLHYACELSKGVKGSFLECATGSGEITAAVLRQGNFNQATVVDISSNMLEHSKELIRANGVSIHPDFVESDIFECLKQLAERGKKFDLILCLGLVAHTGRLLELLELLDRCLNPDGGRLIFQITLLDHWGTKFVRLLTARRHERLRGYSISYYRNHEFESAIRQSGLMVFEQKRFGLSFPFGDKLNPKANYLIEQFCDGFSSRYGSEVMVSIVRKESIKHENPD